LPVLLFLFWIVLNGRFTFDVIVVGVIVTILVSIFNYGFAGLSFKTERKIWARIFLIIFYLLNIVFEVVKSNVLMIKIVLSPVINIKPQFVYFDSPVHTEMGKVLCANSITLTPGSVTCIIDGDRFGVHAIDPVVGEHLKDNRLVRMNKIIEGGH